MPTEALHSMTSPWTFYKWGLTLWDLCLWLLANRSSCWWPLIISPSGWKHKPMHNSWQHNSSSLCIGTSFVNSGSRIRSSRTTSHNSSAKCSREYGIKNVYSSPWYPESNGQDEVTNKTLLEYLKKRLMI